jgi:hypothetical protein
MVRLLTFALLALGATSVLARPTHKRRSVCKTATTSATPTPASNYVSPDDSSSSKSKTKTNTSKFVTKTKTKSSTATATSSASSDDGSSDDDTSDSGSSGSGSSNNGTVVSGGSTSSSAVFPVTGVNSGWSVAKAATPASIDDLPFTANTLIVKKQAKGSAHPIVSHEGKSAIHAKIPKGALTPGTTPYGGFSFYCPGASKGGDVPIVDMTTAKEVTFSYSIYFSAGYDFNLGGKLPGVFGGTNWDVAATCSGGRHDPNCYSARLMFRPGGAGELYLYVPQGVNGNDNLCGKAHNSKCEGDYGYSAGRGTWQWKTGQWQTVSQRILLNTPGKADGEAEIFVDGKSVLNVPGITWRTKDTAKLQGIQMQIFHGGHTQEWSSPKDQDVWFADLSVGILQTF